MSLLAEQLAEVLCPGMYVPAALSTLFDWIEANRLYVDRGGWRFGYLFPQDELRAKWTESERPGGTNIEFMARGSQGLDDWFGPIHKQALDRVCVFARTGDDGSMAAFWLDDDSQQRIVHLGSGSGSSLTCVLAASAVDFLRLLAIGYDEICWDDEFDAPPDRTGDFVVHPNVAFQRWLSSTFSVDIPVTAREIVPRPCSIDDDDPNDPFCRWLVAHAPNSQPPPRP